MDDDEVRAGTEGAHVDALPDAVGSDKEIVERVDLRDIGLVTIDGVQKVTQFGEQSPVVNVFVSLSALSNFALKPDDVIRVLQSQNALVSSGEKLAGQMEIKIIESGTYKTLDDIANQLLTTPTGRQVRLRDMARVEQGYVEPPAALMRIDGCKGIGIGISTASDKDVVKTGDDMG